jgi:hypothetical protein
MNAVGRAVAYFADDIATMSGEFGQRVVIDQRDVLDRSADLTLTAPGVWSPNRSCRLVKAADGWIALNLAREDDRSLVPALFGGKVGADCWSAVIRGARGRTWRRLVADARLLGLPLSAVAEVKAKSPDALLHRLAAGRRSSLQRRLNVVDCSALWAGPLCGAVLSQFGAAVTKVESMRRPDAVRIASPSLFSRLNGRKAQLVLDFTCPRDLARLRQMISVADVLITSARPRAFEQLGLSAATLFRANPRLVWVAITGYGWMSDGADRVAFGDDAAAAGGLLRWSPCGSPRFIGDALSDPITGLAAAAGALKAIKRGGGILVDAALTKTAAGVAAWRR